MFQSLVTMATSMQQADDNSELSEQQTRSFQSEPQASKRLTSQVSVQQNYYSENYVRSRIGCLYMYIYIAVLIFY